MLNELKKDLQKAVNPEKAKILQRFFKTGKGEYGEGDVFLGISVPNQRKIVKKYANITLEQIQELLGTNIHEYRLTALLILVNKYKKMKNNEVEKKRIFNFYLKNTKNINNWDLVDLSAPNIVGDFLSNKDKKILYILAKSNDIWKKRIAILSTYTFIKNKQFNDILKISKILLKDKHDLIHKAVGWMLRETGKRNQQIEEQFLKKHYKSMSRTMLRYAIEKLPESRRKAYLEGTI